MAKFHIEWVEVKSPEWKIISIKPEQGEIITDVSVNKFDKEKKEFPKFDAIMAGQDVEGEFWRSQAGKAYLFAPRPQTTQGGANRGFGGISKAMDKKAENIAIAQDNKEHAIKEASSMTNAVNLALAEYGTFSGEEHLRPTLEFLITKYRTWILNHWSIPVELKPPF